MQPPKEVNTQADQDGELVSEARSHIGHGASEEVSQEAAGAFRNRPKSKSRQNGPMSMKHTAHCEFLVLMLSAAWVSREKQLRVFGLSLLESFISPSIQ